METFKPNSKSLTLQVVHYLVSCGIDHRDIKDENILLNPTTLQIKLLDFGSASKLSPDPYTTYQGTDVYLPPEYYRERKYSAFPAAVWTIGCLVHCLIAGDCPFNEKTEIQDYVKLQWLDDGDDLAKDFINRCMNNDADQRLDIVSLLKHRWFNEPEINPSLWAVLLLDMIHFHSRDSFICTIFVIFVSQYFNQIYITVCIYKQIYRTVCFYQIADLCSILTTFVQCAQCSLHSHVRLSFRSPH